MYLICFVAAWVEFARAAYVDAQTRAVDALPATNPIRLGLALKYTLFLNVIDNDAMEACDVLREVLVVFC